MLTNVPSPYPKYKTKYMWPKCRGSNKTSDLGNQDASALTSQHRKISGFIRWDLVMWQSHLCLASFDVISNQNIPTVGLVSDAKTVLECHGIIVVRYFWTRCLNQTKPANLIGPFPELHWFDWFKSFFRYFPPIRLQFLFSETVKWNVTILLV